MSLQVTATDPEEDALVFSASGLPDGLAMSDTGLVSGSPTTAGASEVTVTVDDGQGNTPTVEFSWQVNEKTDPIDPPTVDPVATSATEVVSGLSFSYPSLSGGKCSFGVTDENLEVVSINSARFSFGLGQLCGARIEVTGDKGSKILMIADEFTSTDAAAISMPLASLEEIVTTVDPAGSAVTWKLAFPADTGFMSYTLKNVDPNGFTSLLVTNNLTPIESLACRAPGETSEFKDFNRTAQSASAFWGPGFGGGNITCRITDVFGAVVEEVDIPAPAGNSSHTGTVQFPVPELTEEPTPEEPTPEEPAPETP